MLVSIRLGRLHALVRTGVLARSVIIALGLFGSSAALAQNCGTPLVGSVFPAGAISGSIAISGAINAANTAFLGQSTAFVSAPANPKPDSEGSGMWIRGVGGEMTLNSSSHVISTEVFSPVMASSATQTCNTQFHQTFGGFQIGADLAKLNVAGWNLALGPTAGFLQTSGNIVGGNSVLLTTGAFNSATQAPFIGTYGAATYGNFFMDGTVRADYFHTILNSPTVNFFNQKIDAHGFTVAASTGYNWKVPNSSWFIEPSGGVIWSREAVDPLNTLSNIQQLFTQQVPLVSGTAKVNDIESIMGRAGLRVGTTLETTDIVYAPFAAASVWHDFGSSITTNWSVCPGCLFPGQSVTASLSSNNIGTFGQYSVGVSGQIKNTGWIGFARVDYRDGSQVQGLSGTGGIRYQFNPTATALPVKAKAPAGHPVNWTGWYAGVVGGATGFGGASQTLPSVPGAVDIRSAGWLGGGTLGYNYQAGKWVVGVEGDIAGTDTNGSAPCAPIFFTFNVLPLLQTTCHDSLDWIATATARLGYAWTPRSLLYVKAGGAFTDETASMRCNYGSAAAMASLPVSCADPKNLLQSLLQSSDSAFRAGWTVGIGTEFMLTGHWSVKGEFDWLDFGTKTLTLSDGAPFSSTLHVAEGKIGLNYKFWPAGPDWAADLVLPVIKPAPLPVKAAPAVTTWDGFYLGGSVGWEQTSSNWNTNCFAQHGMIGQITVSIECGAGNGLPVDASSPHTFDTSGTRLGAHFGNNWQVAPRWLVGVEADVGLYDKTSKTTGIVGCTIYCGIIAQGLTLTPAFDSTSVRTSWDGSLRARAGYLVTPRFLVYGTGGFAERMIDASVTCNGTFSPHCFQDENQTYAGHLQAGWTAGGGIEWKLLNNVLLRGEYRYSDYASWSPTFFANTLDEIRVTIPSRNQMALFGASYLFGGTPVK